MTDTAWLMLPMSALLLDALCADPPFPPHPVRFIGSVYRRLEPVIRKWGHEKLFGAVAVALTGCGCALAAHFLCRYPVTGPFFALYLSFSGLALGSLLREVDLAAEKIENANIDQARKAVSMLVSRDVAAMDRQQLCRALAESLSENFNDGFIAPFFWLCCGGPGALWAYKTVSTADSMWGYTTPKWRSLGWGGARLDDLLAWAPARLSALFLLAGNLFCRCPGYFPGWEVIRRHAKSMASPNAGWPMCMAAWLHGRRMGGATPYFGRIVQKPLLGPEDACDWTPQSVRQMLRHVWISGMLGGYALWTAASLISILF